MPTSEIEGFSGESDFRPGIGEHWLARAFTVKCNSSIWVSDMFWFERWILSPACKELVRSVGLRKIVFEHIGSWTSVTKGQSWQQITAGSKIETSCSIRRLKSNTVPAQNVSSFFGFEWTANVASAPFLVANLLFWFPLPFDWEMDSRNILVHALQKRGYAGQNSIPIAVWCIYRTNIPNRLGHLQSKSHTMVVSCPSCGTERANDDASDSSKCVSESWSLKKYFLICSV